MAFVFQVVYTVEYIYQLTYIEQSPHVWDEAYLIIVDDFCDLFWTWFVLQTSFNKDTTYQGRSIGIRKVSKEYEDTSKNNETENRIVLGGSSSEYWNHPRLISICLKYFWPQRSE